MTSVETSPGKLSDSTGSLENEHGGLLESRGQPSGRSSRVMSPRQNGETTDSVKGFSVPLSVDSSYGSRESSKFSSHNRPASPKVSPRYPSSTGYGSLMSSMDSHRPSSPFLYSSTYKTPSEYRVVSSAAARGHTPDPDKEIIESQLRKLQVENSTLHTENKLLKEKYNRSQARVTELENRLDATGREADQTYNDLNVEISNVRRKCTAEFDRERQDLERRLLQLTKENEMLKGETSSLEKQLEDSKRSAESKRQSYDNSQIIDAYKVEISSLKDEMRTVKQLLEQAEVHRQEEVDKRRETSQQVAKLIELKNALQHEVEHGGHSSVAEKQVKSLERRLKITEERLHQERADRSSKLSEVEEKLINENAKLQTLRDERELYETRLARYKDAMDDATKEKDDIVSTNKEQMRQLVDEKHNLSTRLKSLEDLMAAVKAENDSLRQNMFSSSGHSGHSKDTTSKSLEAQVERLNGDLRTVTEDLAHQTRQNKLFESELYSLRAQVRAKDQSLEEALRELSRHSNRAHTDDDLSERRKQKIDKLSAEIDVLTAQVRQQQRVLDKQFSVDNEHQVEIASLKSSLSTSNKELGNRTTELKLLNVTLRSEQDKVLKLQKDMANRDQIINTGVREAIQSGRVSNLASTDMTSREVVTESERRTRELEYECDNLKHELQKLSGQVDHIVQENSDLLNKLREVKQELLKERAMVCQLTTEKLEAEQKLKICVDERDTLHVEKERLSRDLTKQETNTKETLQKLELEAMKAKVEYEDRYNNLGTEGRKIAFELESVKRLLDGREKEIEALQDTTARQKLENDAQNRKVALLQEEIQSNRQDIERLTNDLTVKMKENVASVEVNQHLSNERSRVEMQKQELENDLQREKDKVNQRMMDVASLQQKLETTDREFRQLEQQIHSKENKMVSMESELRHVSQTISQLEKEKSQTKEQVNRLMDDVRKLNSTNANLQRQLDADGKSLQQEKDTRHLLKDDLESTNQQLNIVRQEYDLLMATLDNERKTVDSLKEQCQSEEEQRSKLQEQVHILELEVTTLRGQLAASKDSLDDSRRTKQSLYNDLQDLCKKLSEKDEIIAKLQEKCNETVDTIQREYTTEKSAVVKERDALHDELRKTKELNDQLNDKMRHRDVQLEAFGRTLRDLETEAQARKEFEKKVTTLESDAKEAKLIIGNLKTENSALTDRNRQLQENQEHIHESSSTLKEQLREDKESYTREVVTLKQNLSEQSTKFEVERSDLKDKLNKATANLRANEISLSAVTETKDHLYDTNKKYEKQLDSIKSELHEEITTRKLAEQKVESLKSQLEELRMKKAKQEDRIVDLKSGLAKLEAEFAMEREKVRRYEGDNTDIENTSRTHEARAQVLSARVQEMEAEVGRLKEQLDSQKHQNSGRSKKASQELKQQAELFEKEKNKLTLQCQQLTVDLEKAREQLAQKNKDNLKMHEEILTVEEKFRESQRELKQARDGMQLENHVKEKLEKRISDLEMENARLRLSLSQGDKTADAGDLKYLEASRSEMGKMIADLTKQIQLNLEAQKSSEKSGRTKEAKTLEEQKRRIYELESQLNQEQAVNIVIKTQIKSLEEENGRLRLQLQAAKRRSSLSKEKSTRSRIDEINDIIARSQARAQQMMSTGAYTDDTLKGLSSREFQFMTFPLTIPRLLSPEPRSHASDDLNQSFNGSLINGVSGFTEHLNNQSTLPLASPAHFRPINNNFHSTSTP